MKIEKISKKDSKNVIVHFDNNEVLFLAYEVLLKNGLRKNEEISESRFSFLIKENQKYFIKHAAYRYLARRHHSAKELKLKLYQKKYDHELIDEIISDLISNNYLDDYRFASEYSDLNIRNKLWGKEKLRSELFRKGIEKKIVDKILEEKFPEGNDLDNALKIAEKKLKLLSHRNLDQKKLKEKIYSHLISKGYDFETAREVLNRLIGKN